MESNERAFAISRGPQPGEVLPYFELPSSQAEAVSPWRYKGRRNLVLVFTRDGDCEPCRKLLDSFGQRYGELVAEEAEVLGIVPLSQPQTRQLAQALGLPFPLLADEDGSVRLRYGAPNDRLAGFVYVADRFGELQERWPVEPEQSPQRAVDEALACLRFVEIQCPE